MDSKGLVLISGVNGYITAQTAAAFLKSGFSVRGTVRLKNPATNNLLQALDDYVKAGRFELMEVPDITATGAFDKAVQGVDAIAHMASPLSLTFTDPDPVIQTAVHGTTAILQSALSNSGPQLATVVFASSIAAMNSPEPEGCVITEANWNNFAEAEVQRLGTQSPGSLIYSASKMAAERAFWKFRNEKKPPFAMTAINPGIVYGPPVYFPPVDKLSVSIKTVHDILVGGAIPPPSRASGTYVDVRDVARLMVWSVEHLAEADGQRYLTMAGVATPQAVADVLRKRFPELRDIIQMGNPGTGYPPDFKTTRFDSSKAVKATGQDWIGFEQSIVDSAKAFLAYP